MGSKAVNDVLNIKYASLFLYVCLHFIKTLLPKEKANESGCDKDSVSDCRHHTVKKTLKSQLYMHPLHCNII